jgi:hypothetical protein
MRSRESELFCRKTLAGQLQLLFVASKCDLDGGVMEPKSMKFIYQAMNAIAGRKHDAETEQCLADEIERELLARNPHVVLEQRKEITPPFPRVQAGLEAV